jgi:serine/threonine-protein kinase
VTIIVDDTHPSLPPESVAPWSSRTSSPAPPPREGTTLDIRRRRSRAVAVALWCGVLAVASAAGIGLWLEPRDRRADPAPARARPATIGTPSPSDAVEPALPVTRSGDIRLHIDSSPRGATVTLHGRPLGLTPIDIQVPPADRHGQVQLELRGYRTARRSIARARNGEVRVSLQREGARTPHSGRPEPPRRSSESSDGPEIKKRR